MFKFRRSEPVNVVVIREADEVQAILRQALETADPSARVGLGAAICAVAGSAELSDGDLRRRWVRRALGDAGVEPGCDLSDAVRELRRVAPALSAAAAYQLVKETAG
ncbi:hypothetical protein GCM10009760_29320 [Kitasatospora kazusensis]|uniref:ANTAR domain-containing protein n=1 Tax=Kitasatospora kazusensis TaxID=407974 RepID=A0ABN2ZJN9_9ACTN